MRFPICRLLLWGALVGLCVLTFGGDAAAQCAMCRSGVSQAFAKNLSLGIIVLLAPPVTIFSAIFYFAFKNRKG